MEPQRPAHLSISQINLYLACPRAYFFRYIEHAEQEFRSAALAFGTAWHSAFAGWLLGESAAGCLVDLFRSALDVELAGDVPVLFDEDQSIDGMTETARGMIDALQNSVPRPDVVHAVERAFSLELAHPVTGEILDSPLVGAIDAIVEVGGKTQIWEAKSAKKKWSADQMEYDLQTTAYVMAARELGHRDPEPILVVATKTKKPDVQLERLLRYRKDEEELAELAAGVVRAIDAGIDHRNRAWRCRSCAYAGACGT